MNPLKRWLSQRTILVDDDSRVAGSEDRLTLIDGACELGVDLGTRNVDRLLRYRQLLAHWNNAFNLVSRKDIGRLVVRHLLDSLSVLPMLRGNRVMDLGTGAGLPGMVLAIAQPEVHFTLVDRSERKIRFLSEVIGELELANVRVCCQNAKPGRDQEQFSSITARAVTSALQVWGIARDRLEVGGRLILFSQVLAAQEGEDVAQEGEDVAQEGEDVAREGEDVAREDQEKIAPESGIFVDGRVDRVQIQIPGLTEAHEVTIVERC